MGAALFGHLMRANNADFVKAPTPKSSPTKNVQGHFRQGSDNERSQQRRPSHLRSNGDMYETREADIYGADGNTLKAQRESSTSSGGATTDIFYSLSPADKVKFIDMHGVKAPAHASPSGTAATSRKQRPIATSSFTEETRLDRFEAKSKREADEVFKQRVRVEREERQDEAVHKSQMRRREEFSSIIKELSSLSVLMRDINGTSAREASLDRARITHDIYHRTSTLFSMLSSSHFAAASSKQLVNLVRACTMLRSPSAGPSLLQAVQILQRIASSLSLSEVSDIVVSLAQSDDDVKGFGPHLDWFVEYLVGSSMSPTSTMILSSGWQLLQPRTTGAMPREESTRKGDNRSQRSAPAATSLTANQVNTLLSLMVKSEQRFVAGHCQAFVQKVILSHTAEMESTAEKYAAFKAASSSSNTTDHSGLQRELKEIQVRNADKLRLRLAVVRPIHRSGSDSRPKGRNEVKGSHKEHTHDFVLERVNHRHMVQICAAISHYHVDSPEALDFIIASAPLCLEAATLGDELSATDLSHVLLAFAILGFRDASFYIQIGEVVGRKADDLSDDDSARVLTALSLARVPHDSLRGAIESASRMRSMRRGSIFMKSQ